MRFVDVRPPGRLLAPARRAGTSRSRRSSPRRERGRRGPQRSVPDDRPRSGPPARARAPAPVRRPPQRLLCVVRDGRAPGRRPAVRPDAGAARRIRHRAAPALLRTGACDAAVVPAVEAGRFGGQPAPARPGRGAGSSTETGSWSRWREARASKSQPSIASCGGFAPTARSAALHAPGSVSIPPRSAAALTSPTRDRRPRRLAVARLGRGQPQDRREHGDGQDDRGDDPATGPRR